MHKTEWPSGYKRALTTLFLFVAFACFPLTSQAEESPEFKYAISTSLWTTHFNPRPEHNNTQNFISIERNGSNNVTQPLVDRFEALQQAAPLLGLAHFRNSFDQSTVYAYFGFSKDFFQLGQSEIYGKVTAGFIHGYKGEFQHKIPFNNFGTSPAAIPSLGLRYRQVNGEMVFFGASGLMLTVGYSF